MRLTKPQKSTIKQLPNLTELSDRDLEILVGGKSSTTWDNGSTVGYSIGSTGGIIIGW
ncbi:hypothetical protein NIES22_60940 [Calothrix brevissima NIES-22]|nr:hypothetical protein NIES22_60940 [Calothrix brevissima NIES-22]